MILLLSLYHAISQSLEFDYKDSTITIKGKGILKNNEIRHYLSSTEIKSIDKLIITGEVQRVFINAFVDCNSLYKVKEIEYLSPITLDDGTFDESFDSITKVTFGNKIVYIGNNFKGSPNTHINIPASVERVHPSLICYIGSFTLDTKNKDYSVCDSSETRYLLYSNKSLIFAIAGTYNRDLEFVPPDCIKELDTINLHKSLIKIKSINFNNVETIKANTFYDCILPDTITLSPSVKLIEPDAIPIGKEIIVGDNKNFKYQDFGGTNFLVNLETKMIISYVVDKDKEYSFSIPKDYNIAPRLFRYSKLKLKSVKIDTEVIPDAMFKSVVIESLELGNNVKEVGSEAFYKAEIVKINQIPPLRVIKSDAFCYADFKQGNLEIQIDANLVEESAFTMCHGISKVKFTKPNITFEYLSLHISGLKEVELAEGAYFGYIGESALRSCEKPIPLDERVYYIGPKSLPSSQEEKTTDGYLTLGSVLYYHFGQTKVDKSFVGIKKITSSGVSGSNEKSSLEFPDIEEIEPNTFKSVTLDKLYLGSGLKLIPEGAFTDANFRILKIKGKVELMADNALTLSTGYISAKGITTNGYTFTINLTDVFDGDVTIDNSYYEFYQLSVILSSKVYSGNYFSIKEREFRLKVMKDVEVIEGSALYGCKFKETFFEQGSKLQVFDTAFGTGSWYGIPYSVKNYSLHLWSELLEPSLGSNLNLVAKSLLVSEDGKTLISSFEIKSLKDLPSTVERLGAKSLYGYTGSPWLDEGLTIPDHVKIIDYNAFKNKIRLTINSTLEVLKEQPKSLYPINYIPATMKEIYYGYIMKGDKFEFDEKCSLFKMENSILYFEGPSEGKTVKIAIDVMSTATKLNFDCDYVKYITIPESVTELTISNRVKDLKTFFRNCYNIESKLPQLDLYLNTQFSETSCKGPLNLEMKIDKDENGKSFIKYPKIAFNSIPSTVTHIYIRTDKNFDSNLFGSPFGYSPWVHVPNNMGLGTRDFGGLPLIYDLGDYNPPTLDNSEDNNKSQTFIGNLTLTQFILIIVGAVVVVAIIIAIVVCCCCCKKKKDKVSSSSDQKA